MLGVAVVITWTVLAVYVFGALPRRGAVRLDEDEDEEGVTVTDL
ncbi:uncharacterized protein COLE_00272 [Cutaneotrichosporon oleaginosum]|nr:hypothetical protein COLE_00272 [Cutaneotrichosporon oleaginosum]